MAAETVVQRVTEHSQRAYVLAQMERRPPGYNWVAWAVVLMDSPYEVLKARYDRRMEFEKSRLETQTNEVLPATLDDLLPAIPTVPPGELAARCIQLQSAWLKERIVEECRAAVKPWWGLTRQVEVLKQAEAAVRKALVSLADAEKMSHPPRVKIRMNADGSFTFEVAEL